MRDQPPLEGITGSSQKSMWVTKSQVAINQVGPPWFVSSSLSCHVISRHTPSTSPLWYDAACSPQQTLSICWGCAIRGPELWAKQISFLHWSPHLRYFVIDIQSRLRQCVFVCVFKRSFWLLFGELSQECYCIVHMRNQSIFFIVFLAVLGIELMALHMPGKMLYS
jgi:hypothetical protein